MATIFREPLITKLEARRRDLSAISAQQNRLTNLLAGKDQFFYAPGEGPVYDWPNPRSKPIPNVNRGFVNPAEIHLIGKDQFFAAPGEAPRYDWPNPTTARSRFAAMTSLSQCNLLETTLTSAPAAAPFYQNDWATPQNRRTSAWMLTQTGNLLETTLRTRLLNVRRRNP